VADSSYSPRLRTAVVLCGAGTAGAYHAGVLRALTEAGVKIDLLAGHGAGVMTALCGAIDGGARLWDAAGPWTDARLGRSYRWRLPLRLAALGLLAAMVILLSPLLILVLAAVMYAASLLAGLVNLTGVSAWLMATYQRWVEGLLNPPIIPTVVPRAMMLALVLVAGVLAVSALKAVAQERSGRRLRGAFWWRLIGTPLDSTEPGATMVDALWRLVRGASHEPRPAPAEIGRRYAEILVDNFGQPGFRELLIGVHDLDGRRDLVGAVLPPDVRATFEARRKGLGPREAEIVDLTGPQRDLVVDFLTGAFRLPLVSPTHLLQFPAESYWRGEVHRVCDRPELPVRLIDEIAVVGIEQVLLVGAAPPAATPHGMRPRPGDLRGRMGEVLRAVETSIMHDACAAAVTRFSGVFMISPDHNPVGPFDFAGTYDEASDRRHTVADLLKHGYEDAYHQFIEPVVAAGERVEAI
jgi:patatin-like phospholipase